MSWNNVLPWWIYEVEWEEHTALLTGAMSNEWHPTYARAYPKHLRFLHA